MSKNVPKALDGGVLNSTALDLECLREIKNFIFYELHKPHVVSVGVLAGALVQD